MDVIEKKLARARSGEALRVLDLFSGCGGLSLGFHRAGFKIVGSVELDPYAAASHALNFHRDTDAKSKDLHAKARDITKTEPADLAAELAPGQAIEDMVDVIVGGPPCQAFARVGRAKLREVAEHPEAFRQDPRGNLYLRYLDYVAAFQPIAVLMENVPDALNYGGHNIAEEVCDALTAKGYRCAYTLLNAVYYGVPEMRERMFVVAVSDRAERSFGFPQPNHWVELPRGYEGSRQVALKHLEEKLAKAAQVSLISGELEIVSSYYVPPPVVARDLPRAVSAADAISDLPPITAHLEGKLKKGAKRFTTVIPYPVNGPLTDYAQLMRGWPGFENDSGVKDHLIRVLSERDFEIFRRMCPGDEYPQAHRIALDIFAEAIEAGNRNGGAPPKESAEYKELRKRLVPPYDPLKFPNKWRKMDPDQPARTLMAHLGKDSYSHIHYDSCQARTISIREAARLQSFPDGFEFCGTMNPAFRQVGNAVPPLLAYRMAAAIKAVLE